METLNELKASLEKYHGKEFNPEEVKKVNQLVQTIASWLIEHADEQIRNPFGNFLKRLSLPNSV